MKARKLAVFQKSSCRKGKGPEEVVAEAGSFVRETACGAHSLKSAQRVKLLLHAESEACSCADFLHVDFLEPDALKAGAFERPETDA